jgi:hypothetical protein
MFWRWDMHIWRRRLGMLVMNLLLDGRRCTRRKRASFLHLQRMSFKLRTASSRLRRFLILQDDVEGMDDAGDVTKDGEKDID